MENENGEVDFKTTSKGETEMSQQVEEKEGLLVSHKAAVHLFVSLGIPIAEKWSNAKLRSSLVAIRMLITEETKLDDEDDVKLLDSVIDVIKRKEADEIEVVDDTEEVNVSGNKTERMLDVPEDMSSSNKDEWEDSDVVDENVASENNEDAIENKPAKKRGRPAKKNKTEKKVKARRKGAASKYSMKSGTVIERTYKGKIHRVVSTGEAFEYKGKEYSSLSILAKEITGASSISGPHFFNLDKTSDA